MNLRAELQKIWGKYPDEELMAMAKVATTIAAFKPSAITILTSPKGEVMVGLTGEINKATAMRMLTMALQAVSNYSEPKPALQRDPGGPGLLQKGMEEDKGKHDPTENVLAEDHSPQ